MELFHLILLVLHVIVAGLIIGMAFYGFVAVYKKTITPTDMAMFKTIRKYGHVIVPLQLVVGFLLIFSEPTFAKNPLIWTKFILVVIDGFMAFFIIDRKVKLLESGTRSNSQAERALRYAAGLSLVIFLIITTLGVIAAHQS